MSVVASSVFILFALIFLGFFMGKGGVVRQDAAPDFSNLVLKVTMPVTVFLSIVDQQGNGNFASYLQMFLASCVLHAGCFVLALLAVRILRIPQKDRGVWIFSCMLSNNGFMGLPLALSVFGSEGMFMMAMGNIITNLLIFSVGVKLLTKGYDSAGRISVRQMFVNNINIAVVLGFVFLIFNLPVPDLLDDLLGYIGNITSGLSMIVCGLSLSRLQIREVFADKRMFLLPVVRLLLIPLAVMAVLAVLPFELDTSVRSILILTACLPSASAQSMISEQYHGNTAGASRAVFLTTLFSVITVPLVMAVAL